jgi:hypothetical protein
MADDIFEQIKLFLPKYLTPDEQHILFSGVILSNSCDIDQNNPRALPTSVLFAPLISLDRYCKRLLAAGKTDAQVQTTLASIRAQRVTSVFFLPHAPYGPPEGIILLDDIHAHPLKDFLVCDRSQLFRLNQYGFYIFLIKLSIHFSRFQQEGVKRMSA